MTDRQMDDEQSYSYVALYFAGTTKVRKTLLINQSTIRWVMGVIYINAIWSMQFDFEDIIITGNLFKIFHEIIKKKQSVFVKEGFFCLQQKQFQWKNPHSLHFDSALHSQLTSNLVSASRSSIHISSPTTPSHRNPFVHFDSRAFASPSCLHGNENVNPSGSFSSRRFCSEMNLPIQPAMWSNNCKTEKQSIMWLYIKIVMKKLTVNSYWNSMTLQNRQRHLHMLATESFYGC